jgi:hypothetical protein
MPAARLVKTLPGAIARQVRSPSPHLSESRCGRKTAPVLFPPDSAAVLILFLMRYIWTRRDPPMTRILLIESGSRSLLEKLHPHLRAHMGPDVPIDLVTCYAGLPAGFNPNTSVFRVADYATPERRRELIRELRGRRYAIAGMICSAEPIMTKWKWMLALRVPAKFFIINENGDYFWANRAYASSIRQFVSVRMGLAGAGALRTFARLLLFPFSVLFLVLYALMAHARRRMRLALHPQKTHPQKT